MSDPYQGSVNCYWCALEDRNAGIEPLGMRAVCKGKDLFEGKFACRAHGDLLLVAGWYGGLLPEMDESIKIMQEDLNS